MSKFGLIGQSIRFSYSKLIHEDISSIKYDLIELTNSVYVDEFLSGDFKAINVTRPYKTQAYKRCDYLSEDAKSIEVVNVVKKINNKLYGYNTDVFGFEYLLDINNINVKNKVCLILGTGATSKTIKYVLAKRNAKDILFMSRNPSEDKQYSYNNNDVLEKSEIIINTTPTSMNCFELNTLIDLYKCKNLETLIDINYKPHITNLMWDALKLGKKAINGLAMLVAQAIKANEIFLDIKYDEDFYKNEYKKTFDKIRNISLIGHPFAGKTTVGMSLAKQLNKEFVDIDKEIESIKELSIPEIFDKYGEEHFRYLESQVIKNNMLSTNSVIVTGAGAVLNEDNMRWLNMNSIVINIERDIEKIEIEDNRPLSKSKDELINLINQRHELYIRNSMSTVKNIKDINSCIEEIIKTL